MADDTLSQSTENNSDERLSADDAPRRVPRAPTRPNMILSEGLSVTEQFDEEHKSEDMTNTEQQHAIVDESEVYFLIADYLKRRSACHKAADVLIQELAEHQLLKHSVDWTGKQRVATYEDYRLRHRDLSSRHLVELLQGAKLPPSSTQRLAQKQASSQLLEPPTSLLLKKKVTPTPILSLDERKKLAKDLIQHLFALRSVYQTLQVVENVIQKYERYQQYTSLARLDQLPPELHAMLVHSLPNGSNALPHDEMSDPEHANVTTLAADVRALRQFFHLRAKKTILEQTIETMTHRAKHAGLFHTTVRSGRNQTSRLARREITWRTTSSLPPAYVYSRIRRLKTLSGHLQIQAYCLAYDQDGNVVITGSDDRLVKIWSLTTGALLLTLRGHVGNITDLAVNHVNTLLASSSDDKTVRVWELSSGAPVAVLGGHASVINAVRFHPTRNIIVTASDDGRCFCYKVPELPRHQPVVRETKIETARRLYAQKAYMLSLQPILAMKHAVRDNTRSCKVHCVTFSPCGEFVASGGHDGMARVWDLSIVSAPDAPVVVPRFEPTNEPQEVPVPVPVPEERSTNATQVETRGRTDTPLPYVTNQEHTNPPERETSRQQTQPPQVQTDLPSLSLSDDAVACIEPIAVFKGHKGPVSSIVYNHRGDRIVTASIKDSAARMWQWKRKYKSVQATVLLAHDASVDEDDSTALYGVRGRKKAVPVVDMVAWTHDDQRLITLHSVKLQPSESIEPQWEQRIRVWDPTSGNLMMTLGAIDPDKQNGHVNAAFVLSTHPSDWRIVLTAGYDGRVFLWDISTGRLLKSFTNLSPELKPLSNLDGGFTPRGDGFCFTDQIGRLVIFGTGSGEQYAATPVQQYFLHDYGMLVTDGHYNVRDRETRQVPSLMESGPLMDASLLQYRHQPPHLLPTAFVSSTDYEEQRRLRVQQSRESELQCAVRHEPETDDEMHEFPLAIVPQDEAKSREKKEPVVVTGSHRLNGAPVLLSELRRRGYSQVARRRETRTEERDTSVLEIEISSEDDRSDEDFQVPTPRHAGAEEDDDEEEEDEEEEEEEEDELELLSETDGGILSPAYSRYRRLRSTRQRESSRRFPARRGRRIHAEAEEKEEEEELQQGRAGRRTATRARSRVVRERDVEEEKEDATQATESPTRLDADASHEINEHVVVESNDGVLMGNNQLDRFDGSVTYFQMLENKRAQLGNEALIPLENTHDALIPCALCGIGNDSGMLTLPGEGMGVFPLIYGLQRVFVHDQCAIASPRCFNRDGKWYNVTKEIRRGRALVCVSCQTRGATIGCTIAACSNSYHWKCAIAVGWAVDQLYFFCPAHQGDREHDVEAGNSTTRTASVTIEASESSGGARIEPVSKRFGLRFHRDWLQLENLRSIHQYVPQVGDYVVYLPEGHRGYLQYGTLPLPRWYRALSSFFAVKCRVVDVTYVFPTVEEYTRCNVIKCELSLVVLAVPTVALHDDDGDEQKEEETESSDWFHPDSSVFAAFTSVNESLEPNTADNVAPSSRFTFQLVYHSNDVANFLVLEHVYDTGVCSRWQVGDRVQMPFVQLNEGGLEIEAKVSYGTIEAIELPPSTRAIGAGLSPWECLRVKWDDPDDETCGVCPWELEAAVLEIRRSHRAFRRACRSTRLFLSRCLIGTKRDVVLQDLQQLLTLSIARDFIEPVDETTFLDYPIAIANPMDLTMIQKRVEQGYYRQIEAFLADVQLVQRNCETYNISSSAIAQNARSLYAAVWTQTQRHFPHIGPREAASETALFVYPAEDVTTTLGMDEHDDAEVDALLDIGLLTRQGTEEARDAASNVALLESVESTVAELEVAEDKEEKVEEQKEEEIEIEIEIEPVAARLRRHREETDPPTRRSSDVVETSTRKRQRVTPDVQLLTYTALMDKYSSRDREAIGRACSDDLGAVLQVFHEALSDADTSGIFASPVTDAVAPQYSKLIRRPMDFGTIQDRLDKYRSFRDYFAHVELVFANAITYNGWDSFIGGLVQDLQGYCTKFLLDAAGVGPTSAGTTTKGKRQKERSVRLQPAARRRRGRPKTCSEDAEESWQSSSEEEEEEEEEDEEDDEEEEEEFSDESDDGKTRSRLRRSTAAFKSKKRRRRRR